MFVFFFKPLKKFHSGAVMIVLEYQEAEARLVTGGHDQVRHYSLAVQVGRVSLSGLYVKSHLPAFRDVH